MSGNAEKKPADLGIVLPVPPAAIANYVSYVRSGIVCSLLASCA